MTTQNLRIPGQCIGARVSIVIPCFNAASTIGATIKSALSQENVLREVTVIDDGSTDDSLAIARSFEPHVRVLTGPNRGVSAARNRGIASTVGEWILFLDADDLLVPRTLTRRLKTAEETGADVVVCDWEEFFDHGDGTVDRTMGSVDLEALRGSIGTGFVADIWVTTAALLYRRSVVEKIGGFREDLPVIQDARFLSDATYHRARFVHSPHLGALYRISMQGLSRRDPARFWRDVLLSGGQIHTRWQASGTLTSKRISELAAMYNAAAYGLFRAGDPAFREAVATLRAYGLSISRRNRLAELLSYITGYRHAARIAERWTKTQRIVNAMCRRSEVLQPPPQYRPRPVDRAS